MSSIDLQIPSFKKYQKHLESFEPIRKNGKVRQIIGTVVESAGPEAPIGEFCLIEDNHGRRIPAEIVGFRESRCLLMPLGEMVGISSGNRVVATGRPFTVGVSPELLGRVLNGLGEPIDGKGVILAERQIPIQASPPLPMSRRRIDSVLSTGIRSLDALLTLGKGQRMGIFSGSGVGKSTLMGMIARSSRADVNVIALIGERGREVLDFIEKDLKQEGLSRSVVVAVTSDQPPLIRIKGALAATAIAEYFRDSGKHVMLMMDSVTRIAQAQRELGLAIGEPPTTRGYTPSVFMLLPRLLERSGTSSRGTITGLYTVLVEGDDLNEPVTDAVRSILDGHVVLSRGLAEKNHYPAVDVLASISRLMVDITSPEHQAVAGKLREVLASYREAEDLINVGAYIKGSNPKVDFAIDKINEANAFLAQGLNEITSFDDTLIRLQKLFA